MCLCVLDFSNEFFFFSEHDVDLRNLERHRRDALAMEKLTSSPHIVDIYGYCANTVLTEFVPRGLDTVLVQHPPKQPQQRLDWALQTAQGVAALHEHDIIHADLDTKQFLLSDDGTIKLNDFNRCRFLPYRNNRTGETCPIRIPSAPGVARSPEEYNMEELTEQLDVYSLGNVLYRILTSKKPFYDWGGNRVKDAVKKGQKPEIPPENRPPSSKDAALAVLVHFCMEHNPQKRITAKSLVRELKVIITNQTG